MGKQIVIIGAGLAGTTAARELSQAGQPVTLVDPEAGDTYERPPLSKHLFDDARYHLPYHLESDEGITFVRHRAVSLTLAEAGAEIAGTVHLASGETLDFTHCILATGMEADRPEIPGYPDALPVYNLGEAEWIRGFVAEAGDPLDVGVLGSGYLGIEVASAAVAAGHKATVYLRGTEPLRRQLSAPVRQALFAKHKEAGVRFVTEHTDAAAIPQGVHDLFVTSVGARPVRIPINGALPTTDEHPADPEGTVAGEAPTFAWDVDAHLRTAYPGVWAAGDCAHITGGRFPLNHPWACEPVAESHGKYLAEQILAEDADSGVRDWTIASAGVEPWDDVPWHWSFQGQEKVFTAGLTSPDATDTIVRSDPSGVKFQVFHFEGPEPEAELVGVETLNWPPMQAAARRVLASSNRPTRAQLENPEFDFKAHSRL
ncbi:FAD-dependent oxidoreductase [Brevibacterium casei]